MPWVSPRGWGRDLDPDSVFPTPLSKPRTPGFSLAFYLSFPALGGGSGLELRGLSDCSSGRPQRMGTLGSLLAARLATVSPTLTGHLGDSGQRCMPALGFCSRPLPPAPFGAPPRGPATSPRATHKGSWGESGATLPLTLPPPQLGSRNLPSISAVSLSLTSCLSASVSSL